MFAGIAGSFGQAGEPPAAVPRAQYPLLGRVVGRRRCCTGHAELLSSVKSQLRAANTAKRKIIGIMR